MDLEQARHKMIEQQIRPWDVLDQEVLDLLTVVRREDFVPPKHRALAFMDLEIPLDIEGFDAEPARGETMFAPRVEARLLQALAPRAHETAVEVGAGSGYMAALLAARTQAVTSYEVRPELARFAADNLARAGVTNAKVENTDGARELLRDGPALDVIVLSGAVPFVPDALLARLAPGGRLVAVVGEAPVMSARLVTRVDAGGAQPRYEAHNLFETVTPQLSGFPQRERFTF